MSEITLDALDISWKEYCSSIQTLIDSAESLSMTPLEAGLEAEVYKINKQDQQFALKVWSRESKPDISIQYKNLSYLYNHGCAVSRPYGWGLDVNQNQVLLTSFDGSPIQKVNKAILTNFARMLIDVHTLQVEIVDELSIPTYDFINYFFPQIIEHLDIQQLLVELVKTGVCQASCRTSSKINVA